MATSTASLLTCAGLGLALAVRWGEGAQAQSDSGRLLGLRIPDHDVQRAVEDGLRRSQTFRRLVDAVEHSRAFVYIVRVPYLRDKMEGCVVLVAGGAGEDRYLRMMIRSGLASDRMTIVVGHELQHVLEILEQTTKTTASATLDAPGATWVTTRQLETPSAVDVEIRIAAELRATAHSRAAKTRQLVPSP